MTDDIKLLAIDLAKDSFRVCAIESDRAVLYLGQQHMSERS